MEILSIVIKIGININNPIIFIPIKQVLDFLRNKDDNDFCENYCEDKMK